MTSKSLINSVDSTVEESLTGLVLTYPHLELHASKRVVLAPNWSKKREKVALVSGGGSGHEPYASGFVGNGMLTASVAGPVYASPPSNHILHAIKCAATNNSAGCFVIIPNYTGDCLNFGLAIEKTKLLNIKVDQVIVADDCSIPLDEQGRAGKRGLSGIMFVMKIAGALAEEGKGISEIAKYAQLVVDNAATYGVGLLPCAIPGQSLMFDLPDDEIEFGLGVHGEAGYKRMKIRSADAIVGMMLSEIVKTLKLAAGVSVVVIVNNFGALSQLEQGIVVQEAVKQLESMRIMVHRVYSGLFMTSLNASGVHISVLKLPENEKAVLLRCLDAGTDAPRWPGCIYSRPSSNPKSQFSKEMDKERASLVGPKLNSWQQNLLQASLRNVCEAIVKKESAINELDKGCGDGDCGTTLRQFTDGIVSAFKTLPISHPSSLLTELASIAEERMGGTSGALYSLMLTAAAAAVMIEKPGESWPSIWSRAFRAGINGILKYSKARLGDKTMELEKSFSGAYQEVAKKVADATRQGCETTKNMIPKAGRASYVKQAKYLKNLDAGAVGVMTWVLAIVETITSFK